MNENNGNAHIFHRSLNLHNSFKKDKKLTINYSSLDGFSIDNIYVYRSNIDWQKLTEEKKTGHMVPLPLLSEIGYCMLAPQTQLGTSHNHYSGDKQKNHHT